jgi:preprotein translocase subunit SecA
MNDEELKQYQEKTKDILDNEKSNLEKFVMLRTIDMLWMEHLETMECLRDSVSLRAYGQHDPLVEYKNEGHRLFGHMMNEINNAIVDMLLKVELKGQDTRPQRQQVDLHGGQAKNQKHIGRNDPCPCGAKHPDGRLKKYKHCCGK